MPHNVPVRSAPESPFDVIVTEPLWPCRKSESPICCLYSRSDQARQIILTQWVLYNWRNSWRHKMSIWRHHLLSQDFIFERLYLPKHIIHFVCQMYFTIKITVSYTCVQWLEHLEYVAVLGPILCHVVYLTNSIYWRDNKSIPTFIWKPEAVVMCVGQLQGLWTENASSRGFCRKHCRKAERLHSGRVNHWYRGGERAWETGSWW